MATSLFATPFLLNSVNDPYEAYYLLANPSYSLTNFKYRATLYTLNYTGASATAIVTEYVPPRPSTGYGLFSPFKSLQANLNYDLNSLKQLWGTNSVFFGATQTPNQLLPFYLNYGYSYNPNLNIAGVLNVGGFFGFSFSTPHGMSLADQINIQSDNPFFNGLSTVTNVLSTTRIAINKTFSASSAVSTGTVTNLIHIDGNSSNYYAYNGTKQYGEQNIDYSTRYVLGATGGSRNMPFLTEYPVTREKLIQLNQFESLSLFLNWNPSFVVAGLTGSLKVAEEFRDSNNNIITTFTNTVNFPLQVLNQLTRWDVNIGSQFGGGLTPSSYRVWVTGATNSSLTMSEVRTFRIDNSCSPYPTVRIMWLNKFGSFEYFNFRRCDTKTLNISKTEYRNEFILGQWSYTTGSRNRTIVGKKVIEQHVINTDFVTQDVYYFLMGIMTSPEVYVVNENYVKRNTADAVADSPFYPIIVTDSSVEQKQAIKDTIFNFTVTYETSYDIETITQ